MAHAIPQSQQPLFVLTCGHVPVGVSLSKQKCAPQVVELRSTVCGALTDFEAARHDIFDGGRCTSDLTIRGLAVGGLDLVTFHVRIDDASTGKMRQKLLECVCFVRGKRLTIDFFSHR